MIRTFDRRPNTLEIDIGEKDAQPDSTINLYCPISHKLRKVFLLQVTLRESFRIC